MARTRARATTAKTASATTTAANTSAPAAYTLHAEAETPPRLFVIPKKATDAARIVTLQHPRYGKPTRYLVCPEAGFFEFTKIAAPKTTPRSWLIESATQDGAAASAATQTTKSADFYVATPIDPLFLILPTLAAGREKKKRMFLSSEDHFDAVSDPSRHLSKVLTWPAARQLIEARMAAVCDAVEAGDDPMFRLNEAKLLRELLAKARRMGAQGLPPSMEEKFVAKTLEAPILGIQSQQASSEALPSGDSTQKASDDSGSSNIATPQSESTDSQSTVSSLETAASEASTAATSLSSDGTASSEIVNAMTASPEVVALQRLRVAFDFICSSYLVPSLAEQLKAQLARTSTATATRARDEDEDERLEKRRKKEEEDKVKKASQSLGVKKLMKVNTSGMKKLSEFFKKK
ncbi:ribonuclease H2, subunit B [Lasiosphaeria miniovina]|uniref:Ribonuclease H2 subunit B n=1 Tax=Lasiosphaeria miniovina TaxID=1954250 RepID=A0AA40A5C0_9PEZI|nr:ribonuclease H2, subunit B [Lasiosphaeria miniovina]KAK0709574.1 ribonuclease H2, subunit B [Lasiosphaeria miniovina]